jgi:predicted nucleic acid-binding protein
LLVAAIADRHGVAVLHYDRDYDVIVPLVPSGTI